MIIGSSFDVGQTANTEWGDAEGPLSYTSPSVTGVAGSALSSPPNPAVKPRAATTATRHRLLSDKRSRNGRLFDSPGLSLGSCVSPFPPCADHKGRRVVPR